MPLQNIITQDIKDLIAQVKREKAQLIIMADVNAWSELWRSDRTSGQSGKRGKVVADFFCDNTLRVMNHGNRYTYVRYNSQSMIDVTVATGDISKQIEHWKVRDALAYSDHCSIEFVLRLKGLKPTYKRNFRQAQWPGYTFDMERLSDPMLESNAYKILQEDAEIGVDDLNNMTMHLHKDI